MSLLRLGKDNQFHGEVKNMFDKGWCHHQKSAQLEGIYIKKNTKNSNLKILFHGTQRACYNGSSGYNPCSNNECYVCSILRNGFSRSKSRSGCMFGPGIYTTSVSSKADIYARNHHIHSHKHVIILCGVDPGRSATASCAGNYSGYDTLEAITKDNGGAVEYTETVVYNTANIIPLGVIVYTREGWQPQ